MISLLIVDDQVVIRRGLRTRFALEQDLVVVGEAANGMEAVQMATALKPDIVLMDVAMPILDGIAATIQLLQIMPDSNVIIFTIHDNLATELAAVQAGAAAFVKKQGVEQLLRIIRNVGYSRHTTC